ncbi:MAG: serine/threonine protein kinase, partial [Myxococcales bacterium]|nr:serine/threonine protein kinase [Myxococcales bacterium]
MKTWSKGETIGHRYRLVAEIGSGGLGQVYLAEHLTLGCEVAVKLLRPAADGGDVRGTRFEREARTAASLRGAHVVQVLDHGIDQGTPYIVMELLQGESLRARLDREGMLQPVALARVLVHVARALGRAHARGIVHRDLKPENVFIVREETGEHVKVLDFGIAKVDEKLAAKGRVTESGAILGTPVYMSPEQLRGRNVDGQADLWSLAVIAFECACGRPPFEGDSLADLIVNISTGPIPVPSSLAEVPDGFDEWFARGTRRSPDERFSSAQELAEAYVALLSDAPSDLATWPADPATGGSEPPEDYRPLAELELERETLAEPTTGTRSRAVLPTAPRSGEKTRTWLWLALTLMPMVAAFVFLRRPRAEERETPPEPPVAERLVAPSSSPSPARPLSTVTESEAGAPMSAAPAASPEPRPAAAATTKVRGTDRVGVPV